MNKIFSRFIAMLLIMAGLFSCKKDNPGKEITPPDTDTSTDTAYQPDDPAIAATIGFFLDPWQPKKFTVPEQVKDTAVSSGNADITITVDMNQVITKVSKYVYGNNSNTWMGQMVTEPVLMHAIKTLSPNIIRGPGGSISDIYFWNQTHTPPDDVPDSLYDTEGHKVSAGYWYGKNTDSWTLSLDHYYDMLQQTGSDGILTVNYGYARYGTSAHPVQKAAHLAADWVRYDNGRTKYWEIGNENNGAWEAGFQIDATQNQDGQPAIITGTLYGQHFKIFADSMRKAAAEKGRTLFIAAQLLDAKPASWDDATTQTWNEGVLTEAGDEADFFVTHDYFTPYAQNSGIQEILSSAYTVPAQAMTYLLQQLSQYHIPDKPMALTEWNIRATGSMQNVSYIAGVHAAITLGELIRNKFGEASRWDLANGWSNGDDQGLFNPGDEPGNVALWNPRPAFYYLYFFQKCFGDRMVASTVSGSGDILCYASSFGKEGAGLVIINKSSTSHQVNITWQHFNTASDYYWYRLTGGTDHNGFSRKVYVNGYGPSGISGGPSNYESIPAYRAQKQNGTPVNVPPYAVICLTTARQ